MDPDRGNPQGLWAPNRTTPAPGNDGPAVVPLSPSAPPPAPHRRWVGAVVVTALAVTGIAVLGTVGGTDARPTPTTTPAAEVIDPQELASPEAPPDTPPLPLGELVPDFGNDRLRIAYTDEHGVIGTAVWSVTSRVPIPAAPSGGSLRSVFSDGAEPHVSFSADGRSVAYSDWGSGLIVDEQTVAAGVWSWRWHPTDDVLAWVAQTPGFDSSAVYVLDRRTPSTVPVTELRRLPGPERAWWSLVGYGQWGFALTGWAHGSTFGTDLGVVLDTDGEPVEILTASVLAASPNGSLLLRSEAVDDDRRSLIEEIVPELAPGASVTEIPAGRWLRHPDGALVELAIPEGFFGEFLVSPEGDQAHFVYPAAGSWHIATYTPGSTAALVESPPGVDDGLRFLGMSRNGDWAAFGGDRIVLHHRRTGAAYDLPFELGKAIAVSF